MEKICMEWNHQLSPKKIVKWHSCRLVSPSFKSGNSLLFEKKSSNDITKLFKVHFFQNLNASGKRVEHFITSFQALYHQKTRKMIHAIKIRWFHCSLDQRRVPPRRHRFATHVSHVGVQLICKILPRVHF